MAYNTARRDGRGKLSLCETTVDARVQNRQMLERDLRYALDRRQFVLHYQVIVDASGGHPCSYEALLRWEHPTRGLVPPEDFIPVAEASGLIIPIGEWVLRQACRDAASWPPHIRVSVNLSPIQFGSATLVEMVRAALAAARLDPGRLELEITETVLLESSPRNLAAMHAFRGAGIGMVMDDFGVGYSSLSNLRQFPFQRIKIDRCFVKDLSTSPDAVHVVRAILTLCSNLGIRTTAEGVEIESQRAILAGEGCTDLQGYLFSRPKPALMLGNLD